MFFLIPFILVALYQLYLIPGYKIMGYRKSVDYSRQPYMARRRNRKIDYIERRTAIRRCANWYWKQKLHLS